MDKIVTGWQCPLCNTVYSPLVSCCTCAKDSKDNIENNTNKASWLIWGGWKGNHDQRIEEATCSNCGYVHPTVHNSTDNLGKYCPGCKSEMTVIES